MRVLGRNRRGGDGAQFDYFSSFRKKKAVVTMLCMPSLLTGALAVCSCSFLQRFSSQVSLVLADVQSKRSLLC